MNAPVTASKLQAVSGMKLARCKRIIAEAGGWREGRDMVAWPEDIERVLRGRHGVQEAGRPVDGEPLPKGPKEGVRLW